MKWQGNTSSEGLQKWHCTLRIQVLWFRWRRGRSGYKYNRMKFLKMVLIPYASFTKWARFFLKATQIACMWEREGGGERGRRKDDHKFVYSTSSRAWLDTVHLFLRINTLKFWNAPKLSPHSSTPYPKFSYKKQLFNSKSIANSVHSSKWSSQHAHSYILMNGFSLLFSLNSSK